MHYRNKLETDLKIDILTEPNSWYSSKVAARGNDAKGGNATYAVEPIEQGEVICTWGGTVINGEKLAAIPDKYRSLSVQVDDDLYLVSTVFGAGDYINHSCDPNAGILGQIGLVALRDIQPGEEICFDYAMTDSSPYDEFECACGAKNCRKHVTGNDWQLPELQDKYDGYFSLYLQRRIDRIRLAQDFE